MRKKMKRERLGQILYKVLPTDALAANQKEIIDTLVRGIKTGDDAEKIVAGKDGWGFQQRFLPGTVGILTYNGIEVALFYKRQAISIESEECDPAPAYHIKDPREVWIRVEFLHTRASSVRTTWYAEKETGYNDRLKHLEAMTKQQRLENDLLGKSTIEKDRDIEVLKETIKNLRKRLITRHTPVQPIKKARKARVS